VHHVTHIVDVSCLPMFQGNKPDMMYLPIDLVHESRRLDLNVSTISQNALKETVSKLNGSYRPSDNSPESDLAGPPGIEPGTPGSPPYR
jgi:hypothetical protein